MLVAPARNRVFSTPVTESMLQDLMLSRPFSLYRFGPHAKLLQEHVYILDCSMPFASLKFQLKLETHRS